jgi:transposase InsO family protein
MSLLQKLYYDPETGLQGAENLYRKAKELDPKIKRKDVVEWLKKQETNQVHAARKEVKNYYPIKSNHKDHIWQVDLMDVSAEAHNNRGVNYLLCCVDIWTRYAWVRLLKNKTNKSCTDAFADILSEAGTAPQIVMSDNGSEFISRSWKALLKQNNIRSSYANPGDHHRMGIVERFNKTIRGLLVKYTTAHKTKTWVNVIDKLVKNYNTTIHSSLGSTPTKAQQDPEKVSKKIDAIIADKEDAASKEFRLFKEGDEVRSLKNKVMFEKGAMPKWSQTVHKVTGRVGKRFILDNGKTYLYYQLQPAKDVQSAPERKKEAPEEPEPAIEPKRTRLQLKKEGVEKRNIREGLRERVPNVRVLTEQGERINW